MMDLREVLARAMFEHWAARHGLNAHWESKHLNRSGWYADADAVIAEIERLGLRLEPKEGTD